MLAQRRHIRRSDVGANIGPTAFFTVGPMQAQHWQATGKNYILYV